ncbi:hypothetical protein HHL21_17545 [Massilia sp. RP-1-19]|uniref:Uncharacterized protein n=1 Tax=Massilia polaris TaxID=2728846 RepID=A0A848HVS5_9BURK|nr:hypothetical protein [Massilia polaris]NML62848.1 hypothetical protein [Massilia polaris]
MKNTTERTSSGFLVRFSARDTTNLVSEVTVEKLVQITGLSKDELVHLALKQMADRYLPSYEKDDGPLMDDQLRAIREGSSATSTPDESFTDRIF